VIHLLPVLAPATTVSNGEKFGLVEYSILNPSSSLVSPLTVLSFHVKLTCVGEMVIARRSVGAGGAVKSRRLSNSSIHEDAPRRRDPFACIGSRGLRWDRAFPQLRAPVLA